MPTLDIDASIIIALISLAVTIFGTLVAVVGVRISMPNKSVNFWTSSIPLIDSKTSGVQNHTILVDGQIVQALVKTTVGFTNHGVHQIEKSDFSETLPLEITTTGRFFHPEGGYIVNAKDPGSIKVSPLDEHTIAIDCAYIKSHQFFSVDVLHDGDLSVLGELKTGTIKPDKVDVSIAHTCIGSFIMWLLCICGIEILCIVVLCAFSDNIDSLFFAVILTCGIIPISLFSLWGGIMDLSVLNRHSLFENVFRIIRSNRKTKSD